MVLHEIPSRDGKHQAESLTHYAVAEPVHAIVQGWKEEFDRARIQRQWNTTAMDILQDQDFPKAATTDDAFVRVINQDMDES